MDSVLCDAAKERFWADVEKYMVRRGSCQTRICPTTSAAAVAGEIVEPADVLGETS